jgi:pimeloyl-ACP methyl ester carboxylesterase
MLSSSRRKPWAPVTALVLGFALAVTACQAPADGPGEGAVQQGFTGDYFAQEVVWGQCDPEIETDNPSSWMNTDGLRLLCGEVIVPANYDDLDLGVDFRIQLAKLTKEPDATDRDAIFINPGGPGGSGVDQVQASEFPAELLDAYDMIGFDPRGVGTSVFTTGETIRCSDELDYFSYFYPSAPTSLEEYQELVALSDEYYRDCVERNPLWWTLSTASVVKDLDIIRQAVTGDKPLNFIGSSYGTTIAGRYVTEFPQHVGRIVLDSPTTVNEDRLESALESVEADEAKLRGFIEGYAAEAEISVDEAWSRLIYIRDLARRGELFGFAGPITAQDSRGAQISSETLLRRGILTMNYLPEDMAQEYFNQAIRQGYEAQWNGLFEWFGLRIDGYEPDFLEGSRMSDKEIVRSNEYEVRVMVNSMDFAFPELSEDEQRELSRRTSDIAPLLTELYASDNNWEYFGPSLGLSFSTIATEDPTIPDPPDTPFIPANTSGVPLLVIGSTNESVTPFSFAKDTATLLNSVLITVESSEHAPAAGYRISCLNDVLVQFFTTNTTPQPTTCAA